MARRQGALSGTGCSASPPHIQARDILADERPPLSRMLRSAAHLSVIATSSGALIRDHHTSPHSLSLESRLGLLRRRRRFASLKHLLAVMGPILVGMALLVLVAALGAVAGLR